MKLKLNLHADALATVAMAKSTEETRYYLNGVFVTPWSVGEETGVMMVATDGHVMATYFDRDGEANRSAIISGDFGNSILKSRASEKSPRRLVVNDDIGRVSAVTRNANRPESVGLMLINEIDGTFPDWKKAIETVDGNGGAKFTWSHIVLGKIVKMANRINGPMIRAVDVFMPGKNEQAVFSFGTSCPISVIAMPMRGDDATNSAGWMNTRGKPIDSASQPKSKLAAE